MMAKGRSAYRGDLKDRNWAELSLDGASRVVADMDNGPTEDPRFAQRVSFLQSPPSGRLS